MPNQIGKYNKRPFSSLGLFNPWGSIRNLENWFNSELLGLDRGIGAYVPRFDIKETPTAYEIHADLPGCNEKDIDVSLSEQQLIISGKRETQTKQEGEYLHVSERHYGEFKRAFGLPKAVDSNKVEAHLHDGVLSVFIPKISEEKIRKVEVNRPKPQ